MKNLVLTLIVVLGLSSWCVDAAAGEDSHGKGSMRLALGGSLSATDTYVNGQATGATSWTMSGRVEFGYFFADCWELALAGEGMSTWSNDAADDYGRSRGEAMLKYYFINDSTLVPYVGVKGGFTNTTIGDYTSTDPHVGGKAGVEWLVKDNVSVFVEYDFTATFQSNNNADSTVVTNQGNTGISFYF